eukprot:4074742-Pyramimonas_sp.AAC.1
MRAPWLCSAPAVAVSPLPFAGLAAEVLRETSAHRFRLIRLCAPRCDWTRRWRVRLRPQTKKISPPESVASSGSRPLWLE